MPGWIGPWELAILLVIVLLVFGPKRLPQMGRSLGRGMREFKDSISGATEDDERDELDEGEDVSAPEDAHVEQVANDLGAERRERFIEQALSEGRFGPDEADDYRKLYDADPEATAKVVERLPAGSTSAAASSPDR